MIVNCPHCAENFVSCLGAINAFQQVTIKDVSEPCPNCGEMVTWSDTDIADQVSQAYHEAGEEIRPGDIITLREVKRPFWAFWRPRSKTLAFKARPGDEFDGVCGFRIEGGRIFAKQQGSWMIHPEGPTAALREE